DVCSSDLGPGRSLPRLDRKPSGVRPALQCGMATGSPPDGGTLPHGQGPGQSGHRRLPMEEIPASQIPTAQIFSRPLVRGGKAAVGRVGDTPFTKSPIATGRCVPSGPDGRFPIVRQHLISDNFVIFYFVPYL